MEVGKGESHFFLEGALLIPVPSQETLQAAYTFALTGVKGAQSPGLTTNQRELYTPLESTFGKHAPEGTSWQITELKLTFEEAVEFI